MKEKLTKKLEKHKLRLIEIQAEHKDNEIKLSYWAGYALGYLKGRIRELEDIIDDLYEY